MKTFINKLLGVFKKEIRSIYAPLQTFDKGLLALSKVIDAQVVVDIGVAQGTPELYFAFPKKRYLLVEANPAFTEDVKRISQSLGAVYEMTFCGAEKGEVELYVPGSLRGTTMYRNENRITQTFTAAVERLDDIIMRHSLSGEPVLLKVDVEGAELEVLKGATETLACAVAVILEVSLGKQFDGGATVEDVIPFMLAKGFYLFNIIEGGGMLEHNRLARADFIFLKS